MAADLKVLQAGPALQLRQETVDCPELGGAVICRGLMASEAFAIGGLRGIALRSVREARAEYDEEVAALRKAKPDAKVPDFDPPDLTFDELRVYGRFISQLLACAVITPSGLALYTLEQWELANQHYPGVVLRLQKVVERLSGMDVEDVQKNSQGTST